MCVFLTGTTVQTWSFWVFGVFQNAWDLWSGGLRRVYVFKKRPPKQICLSKGLKSLFCTVFHSLLMTFHHFSIHLPIPLPPTHTPPHSDSHPSSRLYGGPAILHGFSLFSIVQGARGSSVGFCTCSILERLRGVQKDRTDHTKLFPRSFTQSGHGKCWKVNFPSFSGFSGHRISSKRVSDLTFSPPSSRTQASLFVIYIFQQQITRKNENNPRDDVNFQVVGS